jgi:hypothetical protein
MGDLMECDGDLGCGGIELIAICHGDSMDNTDISSDVCWDIANYK